LSSTRVHVTCRLTAKNRDQLRNATLGNRVRAFVRSRKATRPIQSTRAVKSSIRTPLHISRHLEFTIEQGHRVNWVSGSLDSRVTGSPGHSSMSVVNSTERGYTCNARTSCIHVCVDSRERCSATGRQAVCLISTRGWIVLCRFPLTQHYSPTSTSATSVDP